MLVALQEKDKAIDALRARADAIPRAIEEQKALLQQVKGASDDAKKSLTHLQMQKKEKEMDLDAKENEIRKHGNELNAVKTNDAYKALLTSIDAAKKQKASLEDEILVIMESIEKEAAASKDSDKLIKTREAEVAQVISGLEADLSKLNGEIAALETERNAFASTLPKDILSNYDYIRSARGGVAVVPIDGGNCGGCHIALRPATINDVSKCQEIVSCDSCSRILFKHED